jgi:hypothetical protein
VPTARPLLLQVALRVLPEPVKVTAEQPAIDVPPSLKFTLPVGALPITVAVNETLVPTIDGLSELVSVVVLAILPWFTTCDNGPLLDAALAASPLYAATMV